MKSVANSPASRTPHYLTPTKASMARKQATPKGGFKNKPSPTASTASESSSAVGGYASASSAAPKRIYLIRHGESMGQAARNNGMNRKTDERLRDASLTKQGVWQAQQLLDYPFGTEIQLVVSSPLTRALHTALLAFGTDDSPKPILIHYDLAELGSRVPENTPRAMKDVLADLYHDGGGIDYKSLQPESWPNTALSYDGKPNRCKSIQRAMQYLYDERPEQCIAVVCHYNVIRQILNDGSVRPQNATPICCMLQSNGQVIVVDDEKRAIDEDVRDDGMMQI